MNSHRSHLAFMFIALVTALGAAADVWAQATQPGIAGPWSGSIALPGMPLKFTVHFVAQGDVLSGTIDIQSAADLPLSDIQLDGERIAFKMANVPGTPSFSGTWQDDAISGTFTQHGATFPFELKRGEPTKATRPQDPKEPFPYKTEQVIIGGGDVSLGGTLTIPEGSGPFPAVVLITGSGAQNRDEEVFDHRPFAVLADHLTRGGIAVLRCDDRGVGESTGSLAVAMLRDMTQDINMCVRFLRARPDIGRVGLLGHSEGAVVAGAVAADVPETAFAVLIGGPGVDGRTLLVEQNRRIFSLRGVPDEWIGQITARAAELFDAVIAQAPESEIRQKLLSLAQAQVAGAASPEQLQKLVDQQIPSLCTPVMRELLTHNPADDLRRVTCPVLAIWGDKDIQVPPDQNRPPAEQALKGNGDATFKVFRSLNHLLQSCNTGGVDEYATIDETMNTEALNLIRDWIVQRVQP